MRKYMSVRIFKEYTLYNIIHITYGSLYTNERINSTVDKIEYIEIHTVQELVN